MRSLILSVFLFGALLPLTVFSQVLPDDLHCMPVLIQIPLQDKINSSYGTGIFLEESNRLFLATAAHVIFNVNSTNRLELINSVAILTAFTRGKDSTNTSMLVLNLKQLIDKGLLRRHSTHDVAVIQLANESPRDTNGYSFTGWEDGVISLSTNIFVIWKTSEVCKNFKYIPDGNETYILGYPVELLNTQIPPEVDF